MESGSPAFAPRSLLSLGGTPLALLRRLCVLVCDRRMFRRALALISGLIVLLRRLDGVGLGFLAMPGDLAAKALALAAPVLGSSSGREQPQRDHDYDADDDRDHDNG
jgi:hypothetical protein